MGIFMTKPNDQLLNKLQDIFPVIGSFSTTYLIQMLFYCESIFMEPFNPQKNAKTQFNLKRGIVLFLIKHCTVSQGPRSSFK